MTLDFAVVCTEQPSKFCADSVALDATVVRAEFFAVERTDSVALLDANSRADRSTLAATVDPTHPRADFTSDSRALSFANDAAVAGAVTASLDYMWV